jgi:HEAT repeat protein
MGERQLAATSRLGGRSAGEALDREVSPPDEPGPGDDLGFEEDADRFDDEPLDPGFDPVEAADEVIAQRDLEEKLQDIAGLDPDRRRDILLLREILENDPEYEARIEAAEQLALSERRAAVNALRQALDDADPRVVAVVIEAIEFTGSRRDVAALTPLLDHPEPEVRRLAAEAIEFLE